MVGCRAKVDKSKLTPNTRVALDVTTLTIMRILPREVDPVVFNMTQVGAGGHCRALGAWQSVLALGHPG